MTAQQLCVDWRLQRTARFKYSTVAAAVGLTKKQLWRVRKQVGITSHGSCTFGEAITILFVIVTAVHAKQQDNARALLHMAQVLDGYGDDGCTYIGLVHTNDNAVHAIRTDNTVTHNHHATSLVLAHLPTLATALVNAQATVHTAAREQQAKQTRPAHN